MLRSSKSAIIVLFALYLTAWNVSADRQWEVVRGGKWQAKFNDVFFLKKSTQIGWIVGSKSMILHTADGGKSWERQPSLPFPASFDKIDLHKVRFISPTMGWVCGDNGTVLKTTDGGKTWNTTKSGG